MPFGVARHGQHHHAAIPEHILVARNAFGIAAGREPRGQPLRLDPLPRLARAHRRQIGRADQQLRLREGCRLAHMIAVIVADAYDRDPLRRNAQIGQLVHQRALHRHLHEAVRHARDMFGAEAGVPHHVAVAMLDQVAAHRHVDRLPAIGIGVGKHRQRNARHAAAIETPQLELGSGRGFGLRGSPRSQQ